MADREEDDLQTALRMSLQGPLPEVKRIKPQKNAEESPEMRSRRVQRELMAAAAEKRVSSPAKAKVENLAPEVSRKEGKDESFSREAEVEEVEMIDRVAKEGRDLGLDLGEELSPDVVDELFFCVVREPCVQRYSCTVE